MIGAPEYTGPEDRMIYSISDTKPEAEASAWGIRKRGGHARIFRRVVRVDPCSIVLFVVVERELEEPVQEPGS